ncbi:hypothetical protein RJ639_031636 [Escallonia herrerae]|uniref:Reverse transcriptase Ty1/copia-type domain-containing protein n=1 Tax=Escallonia herrerae TaxID=1293975 RepID=A0AA88X1C6_9ASTE|nr:hypothetical protein RJ639_031636 [Escallonia herrerae]
MPQEAWSGFKPSVSHLRVFGSIAYAHVSDEKRPKLDDKSERYIFIGYDQSSKGYKLYNPSNGKIVISRDVEFDEESSWEWKIQNGDYNFNPFFDDEEEMMQRTTPPPTPPPQNPRVEEINKSGDIFFVCLYVDDLILTGNNPKMFEEFKKEMAREFEMTDIGLMSYYLGIEVRQMEDGIFISQEAYAKEILKRPDILFGVGLMSRYMEAPTTSHLKVAKRILWYIKGTLDYGIMYSSSQDFKLVGYCDSDWAGDKNDRKSTTGFVFYMGNSAFTWNSKKQPIVTLSTCEAEYVAATSCVCHAIWLRSLLMELHQTQDGHTKILVDNKSALVLAKNPVFHEGQSRLPSVSWGTLVDPRPSCIQSSALQMFLFRGEILIEIL